MGDRKVLQHYYPHDFDPSLLPRPKKPQGGLISVRMALPFRSIRCAACNEYYTGGTRFNAKKETVANEDYLGVPVYRLYIKCANCARSITMKTDPRNAEYILESGAIPGYQPWTEARKEAEREQMRREAEDRFEQLERTQQEMKVQMEQLDALDHVNAINKQRERFAASISHDLVGKVLDKSQKRKRKRGDLDETLTGNQSEEEPMPAVFGVKERLSEEEEEKQQEEPKEKKTEKKKRKTLADLCPVQPLVPYSE